MSLADLATYTSEKRTTVRFLYINGWCRLCSIVKKKAVEADLTALSVQHPVPDRRDTLPHLTSLRNLNFIIEMGIGNRLNQHTLALFEHENVN